MQKPGPEGLRSWATSTLPVNSCLPPSHSSSVQQLRDQQGCGDKSDSEISRPPATPVGANVRSAEPETPESTKTDRVPAHVFFGCPRGPGHLGQGRWPAEAPTVSASSAREADPLPPSSESRGCLRGLHQNPQRPRPPSSSGCKLPASPTHPASSPWTNSPRSARSQSCSEPRRTKQEG